MHNYIIVEKEVIDILYQNGYKVFYSGVNCFKSDYKGGISEIYLYGIILSAKNTQEEAQKLVSSFMDMFLQHIRILAGLEK